MEDNELFGEAHEQEENGLFGRIHEAEQLNLCGVVDSKRVIPHKKKNLIKNMITKTEDRHAKRVEAVDNSKRKVVLNLSKSWRRRRTT
jgi:hypothetical protein